MNVTFYYNQSDLRVINKTIEMGETLVGFVRDSCDMINPIIRFSSDHVFKYNYCYIPEFQRYYSVSGVNIVRTGMYDVSLSVDVLMSFRGDIMKLQCIVDKQTDFINGDEYIDDGSLVCDNRMFNEVVNFSSGFNNYPEYILITAG